MPAFAIRPARIDESGALTALCLRAKAHWGYDETFLRLSTPSLTITPELIATGRVLAAVTPSGVLAGMASLAPLGGDTWDLLHMFVEPEFIGAGTGRALFAAICALARSFGGRMLSIQADPHAEEFYRRMGAIRDGEAPSEAIPDRMLPMLRFALN